MKKYAERIYGKTNPKRTQSKPISKTEVRRQKSEDRKQMTAKSGLTKDYENEPRDMISYMTIRESSTHHHLSQGRACGWRGQAEQNRRLHSQNRFVILASLGGFKKKCGYLCR
jgi:hypothetical protein